ncbi:hypothetical protein B1964_09270 [Gordonia sp. i37]|nr:hypothetical protein B1964_09270 [Gordonia sp. i37]
MRGAISRLSGDDWTPQLDEAGIVAYFTGFVVGPDESLSGLLVPTLRCKPVERPTHRATRSGSVRARHLEAHRERRGSATW